MLSATAMQTFLLYNMQTGILDLQGQEEETIQEQHYYHWRMSSTLPNVVYPSIEADDQSPPSVGQKSYNCNLKVTIVQAKHNCSLKLQL